MRFTKVVKYDLKNGFLINIINILITMLLILAFCIDFYLRKNGAYILDDNPPQGNFIDYLLYIFAGIKEYIPSRTDEFLIPVKWLLLQLFILYSTLYYPTRDLSSMGLNILIRTRSRIRWWLSKCIWNICYVLATYILIFLTTIVFCLVLQEPISVDITAIFVNDLLGAESSYDTFPIQLVYVILLFPLLISIGLNLLQMTLSLFIKPLYSFGFMGVILLSSAYLLNPYLPGNYSMPIRSNLVIENGFSFSNGLVMSFILIFTSIIIGSFYFRRYDILDMEENK